MAIISCSSCGRQFDAPPGSAGAGATCPSCGRAINAPLMAVPVDPISFQPPGGSALSITSLVCGIVGLFLSICLIPNVLAIVFGIVALAKNAAGKGMAIAGLVLGGVGLLLLPINIGLLLPAINAAREAARRSACAVNLRQIGSAINVYQNGHGGAYPPDLDALVAEKDLQPAVLHCPTKDPAAPEPDYFYSPPSGRKPQFGTILACDSVVRHPGLRNVLYADGAVKGVPEDEFQQQLLQPQNQAFAKALESAVPQEPIGNGRHALDQPWHDRTTGDHRWQQPAWTILAPAVGARTA